MVATHGLTQLYPCRLFSTLTGYKNFHLSSPYLQTVTTCLTLFCSLRTTGKESRSQIFWWWPFLTFQVEISWSSKLSWQRTGEGGVMKLDGLPSLPVPEKSRLSALKLKVPFFTFFVSLSFLFLSCSLSFFLLIRKKNP